MKNILITLILILLINGTFADIISIGASGEKEVVIGYGNYIDTFYSGNAIKPAVTTGTGGYGLIIPQEKKEIFGIAVGTQDFIFCIIAVCLIILLIILIILIYFYEKRNR